MKHTATLDTIIAESLERAIGYPEYRRVVHDLAEAGRTSGHEKTEEMANYTKLNDSRMKRWDKTLRLSEAQVVKIKSLNSSQIWLVIAESWCGDAAHVIPVLNKITEASEYIDLKLVFRDENEALMNQFLTNGAKSIAKLIMIDKDSGEVLHSFGPRPSSATKLVNNYKTKHGSITPEFKEELQLWYNKDKGQAVISDIIELLDL
ncbi:thioredoxin family protein [Subsaximicrobium wynnwilliamsii]|uniref:Thioredoxin family protein n=1 Tax=Subsaximicrobium wynnwilliamsii TaxID=291179 RepID=A0A5C6ZDT4_9FLAO|nr:thioredoxin family protein [Subsaximicrobium wynnwilliamsii]TXD82537.1 thioredoxin family protein [Subsaximicrobium wynnwilliamsii]TXD88180.1 thioredoxin family protein [Subsaximicrobium wynnwilliamsii]TXE02195.1 thioredoxin family protein [Subsaximicrobium wynnwilliamsii]